MITLFRGFLPHPWRRKLWLVGVRGGFARLTPENYPLKLVAIRFSDYQEEHIHNKGNDSSHPGPDAGSSGRLGWEPGQIPARTLKLARSPELKQWQVAEGVSGRAP